MIQQIIDLHLSLSRLVVITPLYEKEELSFLVDFVTSQYTCDTVAGQSIVQSLRLQLADSPGCVWQPNKLSSIDSSRECNLFTW